MSEIWDWIIFTGLHNTGSSPVSSTMLAPTDGSLGRFHSQGPRSSHTHGLLLETGLSIYACPSRLLIIGLNWNETCWLISVSVISAVFSLIQSWQHQKSLRPYTNYNKEKKDPNECPRERKPVANSTQLIVVLGLASDGLPVNMAGQLVHGWLGPCHGVDPWGLERVWSVV